MEDIPGEDIEGRIILLSVCVCEYEYCVICYRVG